jgi:hypothetical protein
MRSNEDLVADLIVKELAHGNVSFTWHRAGRDTHVIVKSTRREIDYAHATGKPISFTDPAPAAT